MGVGVFFSGFLQHLVIRSGAKTASKSGTGRLERINFKAVKKCHFLSVCKGGGGVWMIQ